MKTRLTILYVEDNEGDVLLLSEALEARNYNVRLSAIIDGDQALNYLRMKATARDAPPPDLILLDLHLPKVDGRELLAFIKSSPYLEGIPHLVLAAEHEAALLGVAPELCVQKAKDWDGMLSLAERIVRLADRLA